MTDIATLGIKVTRSGVAEAERDLRGLAAQGAAAERQADRLSASWAKAGKVAGAALGLGITGAAAGLAVYVKNTIEAERVQAQLVARLASTRQVAGLAIGDLNRMAAAFQAATTFDDESIGEAQGLLLTFTKITRENFGRATAAVLDMSIAMGTDLKSSALQVGKALNDPVLGVTALARAGVQFTDSQKSTIKSLVESNRLYEAQGIVLRELETQMGGSAKAARDTLGGAFQALKNSADNLLEGDASGLTGVRAAVESLNRSLNDPGVKQGFDTAASGLLSLVNISITAIAKLGEVTAAVREYYGELSGKSRISLMNKRDDVEGELFALQRRSGQGLADANDPIAKLLGRASGLEEKIKAKQAELDAIDRELARRPAAPSDWREGRVVSKNGIGRWANVNQPATPAAVLDTATGKVKASRGGSREMPDFARGAADELRDLIARTSEARDRFDDFAATLQGPMQAAARQYAKDQAQLNDLAKAGEVSADALSRAQADLTRDYQANVKALELQLDPFRQLMDERERELALLKATGAQRDVLLAQQRIGRDLTVAESMALRDKNAEIERAQRMAGFQEALEHNLSDAMFDFVTGAQSAKNAAREFFDAMGEYITRMIADQWAKKLGELFASGSGGSGSSGGGFWASMLSAFAGSSGGGMSAGSSGGSLGGWDAGSWGFARGGYTGDGPENQVAGVVHRGEYVVPAKVVRAIRGGQGGAGVTVINNFSAPSYGGQQTQQQVAREAASALRKATRF